MVINYETRKSFFDFFKSEIKFLNLDISHQQLLECLSQSQSFNTHNAFLASLEKYPHLIDYSDDARKKFIKSVNSFGVNSVDASRIFNASENKNLLFPLVAHTDCVVFLTLDLQEKKVSSIKIEHPSNISGFLTEGRYIDYAINGVVTKTEYDELILMIETELMMKSECETLINNIFEIIDSYCFEFDFKVGVNIGEPLTDTICPSDSEGVEMIDGGVVILNASSSDYEIRKLVTTHFEYLLDYVNPYSLFNELIFQRNAARENAVYK